MYRWLSIWSWRPSRSAPRGRRAASPSPIRTWSGRRLESTLGLTAFKFVTDYLNAEGLLPGFVEGYSKIHHDETRHIGYGVWFLREAVREHPEQAESVRATLRELLPSVAESLKPPGDGNGSADVLGVTQDEIREFALGGLTRRLKLIGVPLETVLA